MPLGTAIAFNVPGLYWHLEHLDFLCGSQLSIAVTKRRGGGLTCAPEVSFHSYVVLLSEGLWWGSRSQRNIRWIRCSPHSSWAMKCSGHKSASKVRLQKLNCLQLDPVHFSRLQFRNCPSCQILCTSLADLCHQIFPNFFLAFLEGTLYSVFLSHPDYCSKFCTAFSFYT